jgi:beta-lactam-binding protein with PASTA domain/tRNA A-37 threonylcarbamoyl transferase component Bud32
VTSVRDETLVGRILNGRYKIGERIARGGMASVFLAEDQRLDRTVAVKVMHQDLGDEDAFLQRFNREAKAAAKLNHRGVVSVFDQGTDGDVTYLVMEYVPGSTLRDVMRDESPMSPERSLEFLAGVLVALSAAHAAGIIHRDIKPENVLITPDGDVKVADFGLARAISANTHGNDGTVMGTVSYLAPEIVSNQSADARSDVYACGAMLYEMLTGAKPHSGDTPIQVAYRHVHEDIEKPSSAVPSLPDYVDALVGRATDRDPFRRPADARGLLQLVRLVQRAIEQGLANDPELVAELAPPDYDTAITAPVPLPNGVHGGGSVDTQVTEMFGNGVGPAPEATVQWSTGEPPPRGMSPAMTPGQYRADREALDKDNRGKGLLIATVVAALFVGLIGWYLGFGRFDDTPMLVGMSESEAVIEAKNGGYVFKVTERAFSETAPLGTVISTDPEPGGNILPGELINAVISKGKERYPVPELRNLRLADAIRKLSEVHLEPGEVTEDWSESVPKGKVRGTKNISAGTHVKRGTKVNLVVSKGREPVQIRNFTGSSRDVATGGLRRLGFGVSVVNGYSDRVAVGRVMGQYPAGGTGYRGDTIRITVSLGPQTIKVPNVVGLDADAATAKIEGAGLNASGGGGNGTVASQSPGAGAEVKRGSSVSFSVQEEPQPPGDCSKRKKNRGRC